MIELLTSAQMRAIEMAQMDAGWVCGADLMERAGGNVVKAVFEQWPAFVKTNHRAVVLCGPGNNGGDGFVIARLLADWGWSVDVFLLGDPARLTGDARLNHDRWASIGAVHPMVDAKENGRGADLYIDALFGTGLARPLSADLMAQIPAFDGAPCVAVDIPSGLCADSGRALGGAGCAIRADLTVTFHRMKRGHVIGQGPALCGRVVCTDIGLADRLPDPLPAEWAVAETPRAALVDAPLCPLGKSEGGHKFGYGSALVLSGGAGRTGAARLAARGALRVGAGLVTVGCPHEALAECAAHLTAIMLTEVGGAHALSRVLDDPRINAICAGPAFGLGPEGDALLSNILTAERATVLDADGLTRLAANPSLQAALHDKVVLTPHMGEFHRLCPDLADRLSTPPESGPAYSRLDAARDAATRLGGVVLLKGADTIIAVPDGRLAVHAAHGERAAPWLATAGSGDVLAGIITGLMARGTPAFEAACTGAYLHAEAARNFGPGLIAEDLPEAMPAVFRALGV